MLIIQEIKRIKDLMMINEGKLKIIYLKIIFLMILVYLTL
jgi:hypothetical protein